MAKAHHSPRPPAPTRYTFTFLLRTKDEALKAYKTFESWALTQKHCGNPGFAFGPRGRVSERRIR